MPSVKTRANRLGALLSIRLGPGAAILPPNVTRIHMHFSKSIKEGHLGPLKFWRECLPRLKYHNPAIPMTVERLEPTTTPATMTIYFNSASSSPTTTTEPSPSQTSPDTTTAATSTERTETIDMKNHSVSHILDRVMALTEARQLQPTYDEQRQLNELQAMREQQEVDRATTKAETEKRKREQAIFGGQIAAAAEAVEAAKA